MLIVAAVVPSKAGKPQSVDKLGRHFFSVQDVETKLFYKVWARKDQPAIAERIASAAVGEVFTIVGTHDDKLVTARTMLEGDCVTLEQPKSRKARKRK